MRLQRLLTPEGVTLNSLPTSKNIRLCYFTRIESPGLQLCGDFLSGTIQLDSSQRLSYDAAVWELKMIKAINVLLWAAIFGFWLFISRAYHPTLLIAILATAVLVAVSATAVYLNHLVLLPEYAKHRSFARYIIQLVVAVTLPGLLAVLMIQAIYDYLWGPDPNRFGFWQNLAYEIIFISIHVIIGLGVLRLSRVLQQNKPDLLKK
jgi:hypothetical protein